MPDTALPGISSLEPREIAQAMRGGRRSLSDLLARQRAAVGIFDPDEAVTVQLRTCTDLLEATIAACDLLADRLLERHAGLLGQMALALADSAAAGLKARGISTDDLAAAKAAFEDEAQDFEPVEAAFPGIHDILCAASLAEDGRALLEACGTATPEVREDLNILLDPIRGPH
ncbi:hypothetical protein LAZ40_06950 [Cereibacter sphaeroides]|uniref:hypothetical protein n=1 Tax=Cereibacter sphaeroides TaxID=1063 RepID=UPI001F1597EB|nr:hypothetical protein [Cereibacter sphaeroides]MCE6958785.1 hypothetical protein [Cereibacter sphaeroides]MCE6973341.1 hypothetical protein [Cereibacter sphaeroides]